MIKAWLQIPSETGLLVVQRESICDGSSLCAFVVESGHEFPVPCSFLFVSELSRLSPGTWHSEVDFA